MTFESNVRTHKTGNPASILCKSIAGRYRPVRVADGPITARRRNIKNAYWEESKCQVFCFRLASFDQLGLIEAYNSTNGAMTLKTTYRRKVPYHWLAGFSSDWHYWASFHAPN